MIVSCFRSAAYLSMKTTNCILEALKKLAVQILLNDLFQGTSKQSFLITQLSKQFLFMIFPENDDKL